MTTSTSTYTFDESAFGMSLQDYCCSDIPRVPVPFIDAPPKKANDLCADSRTPGSGTVHLLPFEELDKVMKDGDMVIFLRRTLEEYWSTFDWKQLVKQRGWHAEIAYRETNGGFYTCAPWGGETTIEPHLLKELKTHRWVKHRLRDFCVHIVRIAPKDGGSAQLDVLLSQVRRWRHIFAHFRFPGSRGPWFLDPADFDDLDELAEIARRLIRKEKVEDVFCMQWAFSVLCLALNFPLTPQVLSQLGVLDTYKQNWEKTLGIEDTRVQPLGKLPFAPYTPDDVVQAFAATYFPELKSQLRTLLSSGMKFPIPTEGLPARTILPILPFVEVFHHSDKSNCNWEYVATGVARDYLKKQ